MLKTKTAGFSIPLEYIERIERERGDISKSRFLLKILRAYYDKQDCKK